MKARDRLVILLYPRLNEMESKIFYSLLGLPIYRYFDLNQQSDFMIETDDDFLKKQSINDNIKLLDKKINSYSLKPYHQIVVFQGNHILRNSKNLNKYISLKKGKIQIFNQKKEEICTIYNKGYKYYKTLKIKENSYNLLENNDRSAFIENVRREMIKKWQSLGVFFEDPESTYISPLVTFTGKNYVLPHTMILGKTIIGQENTIGPHTIIENSLIKDYNKITLAFLSNTTIGSNESVGPFESRK